MKIPAMALTLGLTAGVPTWVGAQTATDVDNQVTTLNSSASSSGQTHVIGKIGNDFDSFLGSDATAVITGLRNGTPITLTSTTGATTPGALPVNNTTVITPPTGQMGYGEVYISLALAKHQLSTMGIADPTPEQLQAALTGGEITYTNQSGVTTTQQVDGILTMRSEGMGWGEIAQQTGTKLGPVMAGMKSANKNFATAATSSVQKGAVSQRNNNVTKHSTSAASKGKIPLHQGIVSGSGKSQANTAGIVSPGRSSGLGIVSAAGKGNGHAYGYGNRSGIVTGAGAAAGPSNGSVSAGGAGKGVSRGKGHSR